MIPEAPTRPALSEAVLATHTPMMQQYARKRA